VPLGQAEDVNAAEATVSSGSLKSPPEHRSRRGLRLAGEALDPENRTRSERCTLPIPGRTQNALRLRSAHGAVFQIHLKASESDRRLA
jgi:hypothetical protein